MRGAVTMREVAERAQVSLKTVSNVVNGYPYIRATTKERVERAIEDLGYQVNLSARNLRRGRTGIIGLAVPDLAEPYFGELAGMVVRAADERGLTVLVEQAADRRQELDVLTSARRSLTDGLLYSPIAASVEDLDVSTHPYPLVLLGERTFGVGVDHVSMANLEGVREATRMLLASGARRIAVLGVPPVEDRRPPGELSDLLERDASFTSDSAALRLEGYRRGMADAGMAVEPELLLPLTSWRRSAAADLMTRTVRAGVQFDAVIGLNDTVALGALHALQLAGLRIPEDVQVVGFDDTEEAQFATPGLTSVSPSRNLIAVTGVELLLERIAGHDGPPRLVVPPFALVERGSTQPQR
ncbi:LacI family transcriptional regulator [Serinibacter arcticus]|uniref:LacI family transcriptional regulator n=2 Tax=Serinibacter arcticus TaxID=1655435 RepID=A0A2U2A036_9MICO|nr:LacI family transcriptional regulator [Serinibacter arcticus]